jgi:two-component system sensor histidine kinase/response regulator
MRELLAWDATTLTKMVGNDGVMHRRMLSLFLRDAVKQVPAIERAVTQGDLSGAAQLAHILKTSTRMVGALQMGQLCEEIETACDANEHTLCGTLVNRLALTFFKVEDIISAQMRT